ncbi:MAG: GNAT family N-acetyltransferase [Eubacteriales bacterium]|nr:GNAT family N-acetyltransferase [Eubacteriales bacterium]
MERITSERFYEAYKILDSAFIPEELKTYPRLFEEMIYGGVEIFAEYDGENMVGVITCWEFEDFVFIENFAVLEACRGKGIGKKMMQEIISRYKKSIILEVEKPENEFQKRRIAFYENLGFSLTDYSYMQPPLRDNPSDVLLYIMYRSESDKIAKTDFGDTKAQIFRRVYGINA